MAGDRSSFALCRASDICSAYQGTCGVGRMGKPNEDRLHDHRCRKRKTFDQGFDDAGCSSHCFTRNVLCLASRIVSTLGAIYAMKISVFVFCLMVGAMPAIGMSADKTQAHPVTQIASMLAKPALLCGKFDQVKQIAAMKKPLVSTGRFCVE